MDAQGKRRALHDGLRGREPLVAIGAHDAMTARLSDSYGFDVVWVSGFGVSAMAHGIPDLNLVTMTEALDAARRMDAVTELPVLADCDNGFGGLNNVVRTVQEYERAGIAGICIEDNLFPKRNSLYRGESKRELIPAEEQAGRIRAGKAGQETDDFTLVARVEALIAGHGVEEAIRRSEMYAEAGADAILIHSRDKTLAEIESFLERWDDTAPLVAVPTLFPDFEVGELGKMGFRLVIFANHPMRASVAAIEETMRILAEKRMAAAVDDRIASVDHVFSLVGTKETIAAEEG
jgi:phosphoenolpyruvate phosphomutase